MDHDKIAFLISNVPYGEENAISRKALTRIMADHGWIGQGVVDKDRIMRQVLHEARREVCILTATKGGYYQPLPEEYGKIKAHIDRERRRGIRTLASIHFEGNLYEDYQKERL